MTTNRILDLASYGKIYDLNNYILEKYGDLELKENKRKSLSENIEYNISGKNGDKDCLIVAIATVIKFHSKSGMNLLPENYSEIYEVVKNSAKRLKAYPLPLIGGTTPFLADNVVRKTLKYFGIKNYSSRNYYGFNWKSSKRKIKIMIEELNNENPFILNISYGDYGRHTVTVIGYRVYKDKEENDFLFLELADGWVGKSRYLDLSTFNVVASFTKINIDY